MLGHVQTSRWSVETHHGKACHNEQHIGLLDDGLEGNDMKLFIMSDLEGVAGVMNGRDYLTPQGRCYETACRLLTDEINAAVDGFAAGGFTEFHVADGHGQGAVDPAHLDPRAKRLRGWGPDPYPFGLDASFDAYAYVGQHAKAGTAFSHLTHTGWWDVLDQKINGRSIGEYGEGALCAGELNVPVIFASGELALCDEAQALTPWVTAVAVLRGTCQGTGNELSSEAYTDFHVGAEHMQPDAACQLIRAQAEATAKKFACDSELFKPLSIGGPFVLEKTFRGTVGRDAMVKRFHHQSSIIALFNHACAAAQA